MKIHFIVHEVFEAPGAYWEWARNRGHDQLSGLVQMFLVAHLPIQSQ